MHSEIIESNSVGDAFKAICSLLFPSAVNWQNYNEEKVMA
jgi:hypothetical protein